MIDGYVNQRFHLIAGHLTRREVNAQTTRPSKPCTNQCTFNASCDPLSSQGVFANCCNAVGGPAFAAECRRRRGE